MLRKNGLTALGAVILLLGLPVAARATMLTWAMEGTIQTVNDPLGLIGFAQVNERVRYTFTFVSDTPDTNPTTTLATYYGTAATCAVGTTSLPAELPQMDIQRHPTFHADDIFDVFSWLQVDGMGGNITFWLVDSLGVVLAGTALPPEPYPPAGFASTEFSCTVDGPPSPNHPSGTPLTFDGTVDSFYVVPEPCSLFLFVLGGATVTLRRRKHG